MARKKVRLGDRNPWTFRWKPMDADWKERLLKRKGEREGTVDKQRLRDGLMAFGGDFVLIPHLEEDLAAILSRGVLRTGVGAQLEAGAPNQCHSNTVRLYAQNKDNPDGSIAIATGYALGKDGLWRQHTWGVWYDEDFENGLVVETTVRMAGYFGFEMTAAEAEKFSRDNEWW
jgi:hypothetical protein